MIQSLLIRNSISRSCFEINIFNSIFFQLQNYPMEEELTKIQNFWKQNDKGESFTSREPEFFQMFGYPKPPTLIDNKPPKYVDYLTEKTSKIMDDENFAIFSKIIEANLPDRVLSQKDIAHIILLTLIGLEGIYETPQNRLHITCCRELSKITILTPEEKARLSETLGIKHKVWSPFTDMEKVGIVTEMSK